MPATAPAGQSSMTDRRYSPTRMMVLWSVVLTLAASALAVLVIWLVADGALAGAVLIGAALSTGIFAVGLIAIRGILAGPNQTTLVGAFLLLLIQLGITAGALTLLSRQSWADMTALGIAFIAAGIVFQVGAVVGALRARTTVDPNLTTLAQPAGLQQASASVSSGGRRAGDESP